MTETAWIALCVGVFGAVTWLLGISFFLGRYAARVDGVDKALARIDGKFNEVFTKLDNLTSAVPHRCIMEARIAVLEVRNRELAERVGIRE